MSDKTWGSPRSLAHFQERTESLLAKLFQTVRGNTQFGRVGSTSLEGIPPPAGRHAGPGVCPGHRPAHRRPDEAPQSGPLDSTALSLSGLNPAALKAAGQGHNGRAPLTFIKKP